MLDRTRDADGDIQVRRDHLAGLADLPVVRCKARVDGGAGCANGGAQLVGQFLDQREIVFRADATAARHHDTGRGQFGTVAFGDLVFDPFRQARSGGPAHGFHGGRATGAGRVEAGGAEGHDLFRVARFHRLDRVTCIDRALERVGIDHARDVGQHHHVQQRGHAGQHVLGVGGGGRHDVIVIACQRHDQVGGRFRQAMTQRGVFGDQHLGHAVDCRGFFRGIGGGCAGAQNRHVAQGLGRGDRLCGRVHRQFTIVDFGKKKNSHHTAPFSLSFATSSSTEPTISPAARSAGSDVLTTVRRGVTSTP